MMRLVTFAAGFSVGYVLGTRAGRERYEQLAVHARQLQANPTLGQLVDAIADLTSSGRSPAGDPQAATPPDASLGGTGTTAPTGP